MTHNNNVEFIWDGEKDKANQKKHGISFAQASNAYFDPFSISRPDDDHPENRMQLLGNMINDGETIIFMVYIEIDEEEDLIRIISARYANKREKQQYGRGYFTK